jgi:hypothetical protein
MNATVDPYVIEHASLRARLLSATAGFPADAIEDARQDLLLDYLRRSPKYDSTRGDRDGFVRGVMRNHATVLIARRARRVRHEVLAGDLREPDLDSPTDVLEIVHCGDPTIGLHLSLDVQRVLVQLPRHLQSLASLLPDMPIGEICLAISKSRSRAYQMIRQIRTALVEAGLEPSRTTSPDMPATRCRRIEHAHPPHQADGGR